MADGDSATTKIADGEAAAAPAADFGALDLAPLAAAARPIDRLFGAGLAVAMLVHAAAIGALTLKRFDERIGAGGTQLEAIGVDIVAASFLDALPSEATVGASGSAGPISATDGASEAVEAAAPAPDATAQQKPDAEPARAADIVITVPPPDDKPEPDALVLRQAVRQAPDDGKADRAAPPTAAASVPAMAATAQTEGGVAARAEVPAQTASVAAAAAAAPGAASAYARSVVAELGRSRPRARSSARGTVRVEFTIAPSGAVASARILQSSGTAMIDDAAIEAVRRVRFPPPPSGLTAAELTYDQPYHFR